MKLGAILRIADALERAYPEEDEGCRNYGSKTERELFSRKRAMRLYMKSLGHDPNMELCDIGISESILQKLLGDEGDPLCIDEVCELVCHRAFTLIHYCNITGNEIEEINKCLSVYGWELSDF
jgi:hypothetical protein